MNARKNDNTIFKRGLSFTGSGSVLNFASSRIYTLSIFMIDFHFSKVILANSLERATAFAGSSSIIEMEVMRDSLLPCLYLDQSCRAKQAITSSATLLLFTSSLYVLKVSHLL